MNVIIGNNMKLLLHSGFPSHYRTPIYNLIWQVFGCDFCFGDKARTGRGIKKIDYKNLGGNVTEVRNVYFPFGYTQVGVMRLLHQDYDTYIMGTETRCLSTWTFLLYRKLFFPHKRVYAWTHGMLGEEGKLKQLAYRCLFGMLTGAFVYNERSTKLMIERGVPSNKLHTIYNSLDYDRQLPLRQSLKVSKLFQNHFDNDNKNIVFIGRITKVKRFDLLIDALSQLKDRGECYNVTFIGDGNERVFIEKRVSELGIQNQVWFFGASYDERTNAELIFNSDLCVSPGNIGLTAMHVMMFGCPAITNDDFNHQMPEFEAIHDGVTGTFFRAGDSASLADSISKWFKLHKDNREEVRQACYREIDSKWNPHVQIEVFKKVLFS